MEQVTVRILERDYRLSCEPDEKTALLAAAAHVDTRMQAIRDQGKIANAERIAVLAALNIASDLLSGTGPPQDSTSTASNPADAVTDGASAAVADEEIARRMRAINAMLDTALADQHQLF